MPSSVAPVSGGQSSSAATICEDVFQRGPQSSPTDAEHRDDARGDERALVAWHLRKQVEPDRVLEVGRIEQTTSSNRRGGISLSRASTRSP